MSTTIARTRANKTDAGNGSKAICRVSNVLRSPSPDPKRSVTNMHALLLCLITLVVSVRSVVADTFPHWDVYWMSADADAIVLGEQTNGDQIKVLKWLRAPMEAELTQQHLDIKGLGKHSKKINAFWSNFKKTDSKLLTTSRFIAFLERNDGSWGSIATIDDSGLCGSCGLIWIQEGQCYRYSQVIRACSEL